ncbi:hypothetical protein J3A83DRAFT_4356101 [Scleroderma citrinum]
MLLTNFIVLISEDINEEYVVFKELLCMIPSLKVHLMGSSEEMVTTIAELADNTKGVKTAIINWITSRGWSLNPHIPQSMKSGRGFNHEHTRALLCHAGFDWANIKTRIKLVNEDPWNSLLQSGLLVSASKHIFTSPSSVDQEPKATCSGNTQIHGMHSTDLVTDLECFYSSIVKLLNDPDEKEEVDQLMTWWNR